MKKPLFVCALLFLNACTSFYQTSTPESIAGFEISKGRVYLFDAANNPTFSFENMLFCEVQAGNKMTPCGTLSAMDQRGYAFGNPFVTTDQVSFARAGINGAGDDAAGFKLAANDYIRSGTFAFIFASSGGNTMVRPGAQTLLMDVAPGTVGVIGLNGTPTTQELATARQVLAQNLGARAEALTVRPVRSRPISCTGGGLLTDPDCTNQ